MTGVLWLAGFLAIAGSPPFGPFLSEFTILKGAIDAGRPWWPRLTWRPWRRLRGHGRRLFSAWSTARPRRPRWRRLNGRLSRGAARAALVDRAAAGAGPGGADLGIYVPPDLTDLLHRAAAVLGAK